LAEDAEQVVGRSEQPLRLLYLRDGDHGGFEGVEGVATAFGAGCAAVTAWTLSAGRN
jgi:hypothetical protein